MNFYLKTSNKQKKSILLLMVFISAILSFLSQANEIFLFGNPFLGLVSLIPLFWALKFSSCPRWAGLMLSLFLGITSILQYFWLASFQDYSIWTIGGVTLGFILFGMFFGPLLFLALEQPSSSSVFLASMIWCVYEFFRSNGFLGFPWGNLPYPLFRWDALVQGSEWGGVLWLSFLLASWKNLVVFWLSKPKHDEELGRTALALFLVFMVHFAYSAWTTEVIYPQFTKLNILMIQQNADPWIRDQELRGLQTSTNLSKEGLTEHPQTNLVVWSENSIRRPLQFRKFFEENPKDLSLFQLVRSSQAEWLFGNPYIADSTGTKIFNAALLLDNQSEIRQVYGKTHLVPLAEFIPFFELQPVRDFFRSTVGLQATWVPGDKIFPLIIRDANKNELKIGVQICFEDSFPYISRSLAYQGAKLFIVLTNDSWSKTDSAQNQHFIVSYFRSLETRRPMARSTNSGFTGVIDHRGRIVAGPLPFFEPGKLYHEISIPTVHPYTPLAILWGDWVGWLFWWLTLVFILVKGGAIKPERYSYFAKKLHSFSFFAFGR